MNYTIYFTVCSFIYSVLILIMIFRQKLVKTNSNSAFKALAIANFSAVILEILCAVAVVVTNKNAAIINIFVRLFLIGLLAWIILFTLYLYTTLYNEKGKTKQEIIKVRKETTMFTLILFLVAAAISVFLPIHTNLDKIYTVGPAVSFVNYFSDFCMLFGLLYMFKNYSKTKSSKCAPFFAFIAGGVLISIFQSYDPQLLLANTVETFVMYLIYFTIDKEEKDALSNEKYVFKKGDK